MKKICIFVFTFFLFNPLLSRAQQSSFLTFPLAERVPINSFFDLNDGFNQISDYTGFSCNPCHDSPGNHAYDGHKGIDFKAAFKTPVLAAHDGFVIIAKSPYPDNWHPKIKKSLGNFIALQSKENIEIVSYYGHLRGKKNFVVHKGDAIKRGMIIGYVDNTGTSSASHLHFEVRRNGKAIDPFFENLWITDGAEEKVTDTMHILTAEEFFQAQEKFDSLIDWFTSLFTSKKQTWTNEQALDYVKGANGDYSDEFLEWVGWENGPHGYYEIKEGILSREALRKLIEKAYEKEPEKKYMQVFFDENNVSEMIRRTIFPKITHHNENEPFLRRYDEFIKDSKLKKPCQIFDEDIELLRKRSRPEAYFASMKKVWNGVLPPLMKFFIQNIIEMDIHKSEQNLKDIEEHRVPCEELYRTGFFGLEELYQTDDQYADLQKIYDQAVIRKE